VGGQKIQIKELSNIVFSMSILDKVAMYQNIETECS